MIRSQSYLGQNRNLSICLPPHQCRFLDLYVVIKVKVSLFVSLPPAAFDFSLRHFSNFILFCFSSLLSCLPAPTLYPNFMGRSQLRIRHRYLSPARPLPLSRLLSRILSLCPSPPRFKTDEIWSCTSRGTSFHFGRRKTVTSPMAHL
jgi:hypothetical protein